MKVNLHIERLIIDGLTLEGYQGPAVKASVEAELSRLMERRGISHELITAGAVPSVSAENIQAGGEANPASLGKQIARSVYGGIGR